MAAATILELKLFTKFSIVSAHFVVKKKFEEQVKKPGKIGGGKTRKNGWKPRVFKHHLIGENGNFIVKIN